LPAFKTPQFVSDGKGGGAITLAVPAGVRETVAIVRAIGGSGSGSCLLSHETDQYYTLVAQHGGTQTLKLDDMLGESASGTPTPTLCKGESFLVYAAGFNYPAFESAYPQNLSVAPRIAGSNGQADVTTSDALRATYP